MRGAGNVPHVVDRGRDVAHAAYLRVRVSVMLRTYMCARKLCRSNYAPAQACEFVHVHVLARVRACVSASVGRSEQQCMGHCSHVRLPQASAFGPACAGRLHRLALVIASLGPRYCLTPVSCQGQGCTRAYACSWFGVPSKIPMMSSICSTTYR